MKTVYVIGAGASKAVWGFPTLDGFLGECKEILPEAGKSDAPRRIEQFLAERFPDPRTANLEDILTDLDNTLFGLGNIWYGSLGMPYRQRATVVRTYLLEIIAKRLCLADKSEHDKTQLAPYDRILGGFRTGDAILTFNYDCGIEKFACAQHVPEGLTPNSVETRAARLLGDYQAKPPLVDNDNLDTMLPVLLKLHGSINYFACSNTECPAKHRIHFCESRGSLNDSICRCCGAFLEPVIIPPGVHKSFERYPGLSLLWRLAERYLVNCRRIVVWGFSCPTTDHHVAWLLRNTCRKTRNREEDPQAMYLNEVVIIDPDYKEVKKRLETMIDPEIVRTWRCFANHNEYPGN